MEKSYKICKHVSDIIDFDNYSYFGIKERYAVCESWELYAGIILFMSLLIHILLNLILMIF
jgi:hypothetical protein